jgi:hypothetical protein
MGTEQSVDRCAWQRRILDVRFDPDGRVRDVEWRGCTRCPFGSGAGVAGGAEAGVPGPEVPVAQPDAPPPERATVWVVLVVEKRATAREPDPVLAAILEKAGEKLADEATDKAWEGILLWWEPQTAAEWHALDVQLAYASGDGLRNGLAVMADSVLEETPAGGLPFAATLLGRIAFHIVSAHITGPFHLLMELATQMGILEATASGRLLDCATLPDALQPVTGRLFKDLIAARIKETFSPEPPPPAEVVRTCRPVPVGPEVEPSPTDPEEHSPYRVDPPGPHDLDDQGPDHSIGMEGW